MDDTIGKLDGAGTHIWLRYATQFTVGERTHTIEMGIPVPIGASAETREQLFREAEAGIDQLASHIESRVAQVQQRHRSMPSAQSASPSSSPKTSLSAPAPVSKPAPPLPTPTPAPTREAAFPVPAPTPQAGSPQGLPPLQVSERKEVTAPPTRPSIGASMPSTPGDTSESLKLPQFIQVIKDSLGLTPKQAMDLLHVKALSGLNLREAFEQLQQLVAQESTNATPSLSSPPSTEVSPNATKAEAKTDRAPASTPVSSPVAPNSAANSKISGIKEITHGMVREIPPAFDEEIDLDEEINLDEDEEIEFLPDLTDQERAIAQEVLSKLKEARGSSAASDTRLKVLNNVINDQISNEQLLQLVQGAWGVTALKKLKNDQVEALISWAKAADDFISEAEVVLALIQEEQYARSDR
ncbi:MAG: hypothetical protein ACJ8CB_36680 [Ktedonobacteraceae bacterium]